MSELHHSSNGLPIPLANYVNLIKERRSPYYDIIRYILLDMEYHLKKAGNNEVIYTINPRRLHKEIEDKIKSEKLTTTNICRTILAFFYGTQLKEGEDFFVTTSARGRKNYHIRLTPFTISLLKSYV
ncbi:hypothetical protein DRO54_07810 [Candidatus Bathyarchaeota archaeon]|nr:MAG: hypothetical protein DRO54_07810 [Candidatus Bathyarchaeota archaeon]